MNKTLWDGLAFSAITIIAFTAIQFMLGSMILVLDAYFFGFPLTFYSAGGLCPATMNCTKFNADNFYLNTAIAFAIGFVVSVVKNSAVKK